MTPTTEPAVEDTCAYLARGFCAASIDGYCIGGYKPTPESVPVCHG